MHTTQQNPETISGPEHRPDRDRVQKSLAKRSFATLASTSPSGRPHVAGVIYEIDDDMMFINTLRTSRKARNVEANGHVAVSIPIRRLPVGPPSTVQFQSRAELLSLDSPEITELLGTGRLKSLTGHGELEIPDGCFVRIAIPARILTYGLGMTLRQLIRDPLTAGGISEPEGAR